MIRIAYEIQKAPMKTKHESKESSFPFSEENDKDTIILTTFEELGLDEEKWPSYSAPHQFGRQFERCSRTHFARVTYSGGSK